MWRAQEETRNEILPDGIAVPEASSTEDLKSIENMAAVRRVKHRIQEADVTELRIW